MCERAKKHGASNITTDGVMTTWFLASLLSIRAAKILFSIVSRAGSLRNLPGLQSTTSSNNRNGKNCPSEFLSRDKDTATALLEIGSAWNKVSPRRQESCRASGYYVQSGSGQQHDRCLSSLTSTHSLQVKLTRRGADRGGGGGRGEESTPRNVATHSPTLGLELLALPAAGQLPDLFVRVPNGDEPAGTTSIPRAHPRMLYREFTASTYIPYPSQSKIKKFRR